jgi:hypothetical protein
MINHCGYIAQLKKEKKRKPLVLICYLDKLIEHPIISKKNYVGSITHLYTNEGWKFSLSFLFLCYFVIFLLVMPTWWHLPPLPRHDDKRKRERKNNYIYIFWKVRQRKV